MIFKLTPISGPYLQGTNKVVNNAPCQKGISEKEECNKFDKILKNSIETADLKFSAHAIERLNYRDISLEKDDLLKLNEAVKKAQSKGSKESLILLNDVALIVSVKNKMVITAVDKAQMKEKIFTNIDSTVIL